MKSQRRNNRPQPKRFQIKRKNIVIHASIILCFVFFLLFASNPLFEKIQTTKGEAKLLDISIPQETSNVAYSIDRLLVQNNYIEIEGWAFIEGQSAENSRTYLVFKSSSESYVFDTFTRKRTDLHKAFPQWNVNLDDAGFITFIRPDKIKPGPYTIGIYIQKDNLKAFEFTNQVLPGEARILELELPAATRNITYNIDRFVDNNNALEVSGWAFIEGKSALNSEIYLVMKSDSNTYIFDTIPNKRPDVTKALTQGNGNLDDSGFTAFLPIDKIKEGEYTLGIYIRQEDNQAFELTEKVWSKP